MKKLFLLTLLLCSIYTFAQKYTIVVETNDRVSVTTPKGDKFSILRTPQTIAMLQSATISIQGVTTQEAITLDNFDFSASNIPVQSTVPNLYTYLTQNIFTGRFSKLIPISSASTTTTSIPSIFRSGMIEWLNVGTGTVTISSSDGKSTILTANFPARSFPITDSSIYSGYTVSLSGGALIQWNFNQ